MGDKASVSCSGRGTDGGKSVEFEYLNIPGGICTFSKHRTDIPRNTHTGYCLAEILKGCLSTLSLGTWDAGDLSHPGHLRTLVCSTWALRAGCEDSHTPSIPSAARGRALPCMTFTADKHVTACHLWLCSQHVGHGASWRRRGRLSAISASYQEVS